MRDYLNTIEIIISEHPPHTETIVHINVYAIYIFIDINIMVTIILFCIMLNTQVP